MQEYHHFRPVIEGDKPQFRRSQDNDLAREWHDLDRNQQREIRSIQDKARKLSRIMKSYSRSFSVLLGGHFTLLQEYVFCAMDMDLHFLLYTRPYIWPNSRIVREVNAFVDENHHLAWEQRQQTATVVDLWTSPPTEFPCCDPKNGPGGSKARCHR